MIDSCTDPVYDNPTDAHQDQGSVYETEKIQKLEERVKELEEQFSEAHRDHEITTKERERERATHSILQSEYDQMKKTVMQNEELLKVSLADAEEKHHKAMETIAQLEREKASLTFEVKSLQSTVQDMRNLFSETEREYKKERERERATHSILQSEYDQMKKTVMQNEELLKVSLADAEEKHHKAMETIAQLEREKASLTFEVKSLQSTVQDMRNLFSETEREYKKEHEIEKATHSILQSEYDQMKKTVMQNEELLKLMEKERETHSMLRVRYSQMVETLQQNEKLLEVMEKELEAHSRMNLRYTQLTEMLLRNDKLIEVMDKEREAHSKLRVKYNHMVETLLENEKLLEESDCGSNVADEQPGTSSEGTTETSAGGTAGKLGQRVFGEKSIWKNLKFKK
ncbi:uncharacterized protein Hap1MRO34_014050 [Clarias gariepinus]